MIVSSEVRFVIYGHLGPIFCVSFLYRQEFQLIFDFFFHYELDQMSYQVQIAQ